MVTFFWFYSNQAMTKSVICMGNLGEVFSCKNTPDVTQFMLAERRNLGTQDKEYNRYISLVEGHTETHKSYYFHINKWEKW